MTEKRFHAKFIVSHTNQFVTDFYKDFSDYNSIIEHRKSIEKHFSPDDGYSVEIVYYEDPKINQ